MNNIRLENQRQNESIEHKFALKQQIDVKRYQKSSKYLHKSKTMYEQSIYDDFVEVPTEIDYGFLEKVELENEEEEEGDLEQENQPDEECRFALKRELARARKRADSFTQELRHTA